MSISQFAQKYLKEITLLSTALIATSITARSAIDAYEAEELLEGELPLERITRKLTGITLVSLGKAIMNVSFIDREFRKQVGGQLIFVGSLLLDYKPKKDVN